MLYSVGVADTNERGAQYMEQVLAALHSANPRRLPMSLEFISNKEQVYLCCRVPDPIRTLVATQLHALYPDARIEILDDNSITSPDTKGTQTTFLQAYPDIFPLKRHAQFEDALNRVSVDPIAPILQSLKRPAKDAAFARVAISFRPASRGQRQRNWKILHRLTGDYFRRHSRLADWYLRAVYARYPMRLFAVILGWLASSNEDHAGTTLMSTSPGRTHDREEDVQSASDKLCKPLFETEISVSVGSRQLHARQCRNHVTEIAGTFGTFAGRQAMFRVRRQPRRFLLSAEELATLWHPPTATIQAASLNTPTSREREPPLDLPGPRSHADLTLLGVTAFRNTWKKFGLLPEDRFRHAILLGKTGMGKSTLMSRLILSDLQAGRGVCVIDPHGDLIEQILPAIPKHRTNDVVVFDPADADHPLAFNVLDCPNPNDRPQVASAVLSAFKKLYGDFWGPRMEHILRNTLLALLEVPGTTLVSVVRMLSDPTYRDSITRQTSDPLVRSFWLREFASMPAKFQAEAVAPIQNKVGHFVSSPLLRNIVGQETSKLRLRSVMDEGKILLANLSKGRLGDDASALLGSFLVTSIQLAAMSRADLPPEKRRDFFVYVDEFQNYATDSFATILSEARKYRLSLTLANQYLAQLPETTRSAIFGNIGAWVAFQLGAEDAEIVAEQLGGRVEPQDLMTLPRYQAYARLLLEGQPTKPFSMQTLPLRASTQTLHRSTVVRRTSQHRYATPRDKVESAILEEIAVR